MPTQTECYWKSSILSWHFLLARSRDILMVEICFFPSFPPNHSGRGLYKGRLRTLSFLRWWTTSVFLLHLVCSQAVSSGCVLTHLSSNQCVHHSLCGCCCCRCLQLMICVRPRCLAIAVCSPQLVKCARWCSNPQFFLVFTLVSFRFSAVVSFCHVSSVSGILFLQISLLRMFSPSLSI